MPVCRRTFGALSRSRVPTTFSASKTLVPFLYQTVTIQQWKPNTRPIARREASTRSDRDGDVPFDGITDDLPPTLEEISPQRQTTITGSERAAFEKLYKKFSPSEGSKSQNDIPFAHEIDQIADEWYEEDDDSASDSRATSLDSVFDAVLAGLPTGHTVSSRSNKPKENLQTLAEKILQPEMEKARRKPEQEAKAEAARIKSIKDEERVRVQQLLDEARTDVELWDILDREVFGMIRVMDLDDLQLSPKMRSQSSEASSTTKEGGSIDNDATAPSLQFDTPVPYSLDNKSDPRYDPRILFPNYPSHLVYAMKVLRTRFPSSPLPLSILPTMKSLGRSSYALGATTPLYNHLIRTAWIHLSSYDQIDELLLDMENGGVEPDTSTLNLLDSILSEYERSQRGRMGEAIRQVWGMDMFNEGVNKLRKWRQVIAQRLQVWSDKKASDGSLIRYYDQQSGGIGGAARGPRDDFQFSVERSKREVHIKQRRLSHRLKNLKTSEKKSLDVQDGGAFDTQDGAK